MVRCLNTHRDSILPCLYFPNKEIWLKELVNSLVAFAFFLAATITWNWLYRREKTNIIIYSRSKQRECGVLPNRIRLPSPHLTTIHQPLHRNANILSMQFLTNRGFQVAHPLFAFISPVLPNAVFSFISRSLMCVHGIIDVFHTFTLGRCVMLSETTFVDFRS